MKNQALFLSENSREYLQRVGIGPRYHNASLERVFQGILAQVEDYLNTLEENLKRGKGLLVMGGTGAGKTSILALVAKKIIENTASPVWTDDWMERKVLLRIDYPIKIQFLTMSSFYNLVHNKDVRIDNYQKCDVLMIDDFGAEHVTDWPMSTFENLFEYRYSNKLMTCVTTNKTKTDLLKMEQDGYYARVIDRMRDSDAFLRLSAGQKSQRN